MNWQDIFATRMDRMKASEIRELLKLLDQPDIISFAGGIPDPALFPTEAFQKALGNALSTENQSTALQYSVSEGYGSLRDWIVGKMTEIGVPCTRDNVLITSGSQQALDYLGKLMLSPNDTALLGWPTYLGALGAFNAYEPHYDRLIPGGNRSAEDYAQTAKDNGGRVKFAYMSVDFANPTGETLDQTARENILDLADDLDIAVIEDAAYQALRFDGDPIPPVLALEVARKGSIDACRTLYCGSFSKSLAPGLRVGWICGAADVISRLVLMKQASDLHSSTINQMAIAEVANTIFEEHTAKLRQTYTARRDAMLSALEAQMPDGVTWTKPEGGMFVWLTLPKHMDGGELLRQSLETQRVAFVPGQAFFADRSGKNTLRLSFSLADDAQIAEGITRLGAAIRAAL
ncbi:PLP-dependent aminotransferase family protein [Sulfitobacter mediterraneus]|uniref:aminotransferase-like domain-containing protein n=1 Tax=Sulfitobacter mediterraneus TaxID=83219 RepID=UPI001933DC82|nr:PLP-dependent aminotransferase family protein [Sulfitobacter mediterraneus]MBM1633217.1 PLP-dependent aminotransferase family protein [Sulfitobacter mediterraneus]MBM1640649.1 PLP-dependent aminotransferase family protein [Sulfitobacter mediterraneus]MBM1645082.1 PLP-dependent aminotransferase family protein [Sulfitobacter mediterraneus]MBM1648769.1 PLP-dependent aminotransferase family protein [Sulfitobacter mediterraneus]MBM1652790.1 PLP-dependent aminotransferase family protein [Sulfitob